MLKYLLLLISTSFINPIIAQSIESTLFQQLCNAIVQDSEQYKLLQKLYDTKIAYDPVLIAPGKINYDPQVDELTKSMFNKLSPLEQSHVLSLSPISIYPIKDTVYIVDSLNFLSRNTFAKNGYFITSVSKAPKFISPTTKVIHFYAAALRDNQLIMAFHFPGKDFYYNFFFNYYPSGFGFDRTRVILPNTGTE